jgi:DnaJ-class molecular chaperone
MICDLDEWDEDDDHEDEYPWEREGWCPECQGSGTVTTEDYESYLGAMYKTCPLCHGRPGDGPLS